jgi:hypothetical protein
VWTSGQSSAVHLILGNSKTEDRSPPMVEKVDKHLLTSEVSEKRSKPALNGAFGLSGFFSPKGVVLLQFFLNVIYPPRLEPSLFQICSQRTSTGFKHPTLAKILLPVLHSNLLVLYVTICFLVEWHGC